MKTDKDILDASAPTEIHFSDDDGKPCAPPQAIVDELHRRGFGLMLHAAWSARAGRDVYVVVAKES